jgi:hypothetical protein
MIFCLLFGVFATESCEDAPGSFAIVLCLSVCTARVFSRDSPWKVAQWTGRPIRES